MLSLIIIVASGILLVSSAKFSPQNIKYREGAVETSQQQQLASLLASLLSQTQSDASLLTGRLCSTCASGCCCKDECCDWTHCLNQVSPTKSPAPSVCDTCASRCCCGTSCCDSSFCFTTIKGTSSPTIGPPVKQQSENDLQVNISALLAQFLQQQLANPTSIQSQIQPQSQVQQQQAVINAFWCNTCNSRCCCDPLGCCTIAVCERLATSQPIGDVAGLNMLVRPTPTSSVPPAYLCTTCSTGCCCGIGQCCAASMCGLVGTSSSLSQSLGTSTVFGSYVCLLCKSFCCCGTSCCAPNVCGLASTIESPNVNPVMYPQSYYNNYYSQPSQPPYNYNNANSLQGSSTVGVFCNVCASRCCCGSQCCPTSYCNFNNYNPYVRPTVPAYPTYPAYNNYQQPNFNSFTYPNFIPQQQNFGYNQPIPNQMNPTQMNPSQMNPYQLLDSLIPPKSRRSKRFSKLAYIKVSKLLRRRQAAATCGVCITGCCCRSVCCDCAISTYYSTLTTSSVISTPYQLATTACTCGQCGSQCCSCAQQPQTLPACTCGTCGTQCCSCSNAVAVLTSTCGCGQCGTGCCSCPTNNFFPTGQFSYQNVNCGCGMCGGICCSCTGGTNIISNFCSSCAPQSTTTCSPCQSTCCCAGSSICCSCNGFNGWANLASLGKQ